MKRKSLDTANCPIARTLDVIGDWWSLLIVRDAFLGKRRFSEFHKSLGLAKNILCMRLQKLVSHGIFEAVPSLCGSAYQEYALTEKGRRLYLVLVALRQWGESFLFKEGEVDLLLVDACWSRRTCARSTHRIGEAGQKTGARMVHLLVGARPGDDLSKVAKWTPPRRLTPGAGFFVDEQLAR